MDTPIADFLREYAAAGKSRMHMPGHKGKGFLGCEQLDITEVAGADALYEADGIIAGSEANATRLFGSGRTVYSTEGSSQCIRAMLHLALSHRKKGTSRTVLAARNVHKAFVYAAALLDFDIVWLWPEKNTSLCSCPVTADGLECVLQTMEQMPAAVYLTSPDYLGGQADVAAIAEVCHRYGTYLVVDNAHGAYLRFLRPSEHPLDLGADLCCDSAHKTLPVLTGGAYLHLAKHLPEDILADAKRAMALFGSTSPSYLIMASLDLCNALLADDYPERLGVMTARLEKLREELQTNGWQVEKTDSLRVTIRTPKGLTGTELAERLRESGIEAEFADPEYLVLMLTPENDEAEVEKLKAVLGENHLPATEPLSLPVPRGECVLSVREAVFSPHEEISVEQALGCICAAPSVSCPPAIPVAVSGEIIGEAALELFRHYRIGKVDVVRQ